MRSNNITASTYDEDIRDLTTAVNQLRLAQSRLDAVISRAEQNRDKREQGEQRGRQEQEHRSTRRRPVHPLSIFIAGDYVRVKKNRQGQPDRGVVFAATGSVLVRVRAANGEEVKRLSKNLSLIESADERERAETNGSRSGNSNSQ